MNVRNGKLGAEGGGGGSRGGGSCVRHLLHQSDLAEAENMSQFRPDYDLEEDVEEDISW